MSLPHLSGGRGQLRQDARAMGEAGYLLHDDHHRLRRHIMHHKLLGFCCVRIVQAFGGEQSGVGMLGQTVRCKV